jgi:hypothetical protein
VWLSVTVLVAFVARTALLGLDTEITGLAMFWLVLAVLFGLLIYALQRSLRFWILSTLGAIVFTFIGVILAFGVDQDLGNTLGMVFWFLVVAFLGLLTYRLFRGPARE